MKSPSDRMRRAQKKLGKEIEHHIGWHFDNNEDCLVADGRRVRSFELPEAERLNPYRFSNTTIKTIELDSWGRVWLAGVNGDNVPFEVRLTDESIPVEIMIKVLEIMETAYYKKRGF